MPGPIDNLNVGEPLPQLQANGWFPSGIPWAHFTGRTNPLPDDAAFSYDGGNQAVTHIIINREDVFQAIADLLGTHFTDTSNPIPYTLNANTNNPIPLTLYPLSRQPPMQHPIFQWLYATRVSSVKEYVTMLTTGPSQGDAAQNEVQGIAIPSPDFELPEGGTFTLTFAGGTTDDLAYTASATDVQRELENLSGVGPGNVVCWGGALPGTSIAVMFTGALGESDQPLMTTSGSLVISEVQKGQPAGAVVAPPTDTRTPKKDFFPGAAIADQSFEKVTTTVPRFMILTVLFQQPKYRVLLDSEIDNPNTPPPPAGKWEPFGSNVSPARFRPEWQRYLEGWPKPRTEMITQESRTLYFCQTGSGIDSTTGLQGRGPDGGNANGPGSGNFLNLTTQRDTVRFPSPWPFPLKNANLSLLWKMVPALGLLDKYGKPVLLDLALQTVNSVKIFDRPAGTLKFEGYDLQPRESPIQPGLVGPPLIVGMANLYFDVILVWSFFDPPYDMSATSDPTGPWLDKNGHPGGPARGHNLAPWRGTVSGDKTGNLLWYLFGASPPQNTEPDVEDGNPLMFPLFDHRLIFMMSL